MSKVLLDKNYGGDDLCDVERDCYEALVDDFTPDVKDIPLNEHGNFSGTFRVQIT